MGGRVIGIAENWKAVMKKTFLMIGQLQPSAEHNPIRYSAVSIKNTKKAEMKQLYLYENTKYR